MPPAATACWDSCCFVHRDGRRAPAIRMPASNTPARLTRSCPTILKPCSSLGEALAATGNLELARQTYRRAETLAKTRAADGDPDAAEWAASAARALKNLR